MYKHLYSRFLNAAPERLHFAAHSHHLWPDVTRDAHLQYWDDSARLADEKWNHIFGVVIPEAQNHISAILNLSSPEQICFAPNTHEFIVRLLSCFEPGAAISILSTDGEFHSFRRQIERLKEFSFITVDEIPVEPFNTFEERFSKAAQAKRYDLVFTSQVFFALGYAIRNITSFVQSLGSDHSAIVIDGYHGFCAIPTDLREIENHAFYLSGGYKYAQSGEGACFMHIPKGCTLRPANTGWYASFGTLQEIQNGSKQKVQYADDAFRFWGATFDPSGLYRLNAVLRLLDDNKLTTLAIHSYVQSLQQCFINGIKKLHSSSINLDTLVCASLDHHAHFLTFRSPKASSIHQELMQRRVITDVRGDCLRFGFGLYQSKPDVERLLNILQSCAI